jgi:hypothetical protein
MIKSGLRQVVVVSVAIVAIAYCIHGVADGIASFRAMLAH